MISMFRYLLLLLFSLSFFTGKTQTLISQAQEFNVKDSEGIVYDLFDILDGGQFVFLDFFDVSCGPCQFFAPDIEQSYVNFGENNADVFFIGLSFSGDNALLDEWDSTFGIQYPTISGFEGGGNAIHLLYQIQSFPTLVLIAPDHSIAAQLFLPDYSPFTATIDSMFINQGLTPIITDLDKKTEIPGLLNYSNPVNNKLNIEYYSTDESTTTIVVYDIFGHEVRIYNNVSIEAGKNLISLNVADMQKGIYVLSWISEGKVPVNRKWIKK